MLGGLIVDNGHVVLVFEYNMNLYFIVLHGEAIHKITKYRLQRDKIFTRLNFSQITMKEIMSVFFLPGNLEYSESFHFVGCISNV